jgi:hypothetical protein
MKTLSGTFAFVALAVIAIGTLPSCCKQVSKEVLADEKFCLEHNFCLKFGKKKENDEYEYVEVKQPDFDNALCALKARDGEPKNYKVRFLANAKATPDDDYDPPSCPPTPVSIKTDKITTSGVARTEPAEESSAYDPNAVHRVRSNNKADIENVLKTFTTPSPTPTPP